MKSSLEDHIRKIGSLSTSAAQIADRLMPMVHWNRQQGEVERLQAVLKELTMEVNVALADDSEPEDDRLTEEDVRSFINNFSNSLVELKAAVIRQVYNVGYFLPYPKNVRVLIATTLLNHMSLANKRPAPLWQDIIDNGGAL
jgi:hypothetical protein